MQQHSKKEGGYMLIYSVLVVSAMLLFTAVLLRSTLSEFEVAQNANESIKAFSAAESAIECAQYWHARDRYFDTTSPVRAISCDTSNSNTSVSVGGPTPSGDPCTPRTYPEFVVGPFANGSCARVVVDVQPIAYGDANAYCFINVRAQGLNDCANPTIERVVWGSM